jgi:hypothetical protein
MVRQIVRTFAGRVATDHGSSSTGCAKAASNSSAIFQVILEERLPGGTI